MTVKYTQDLDNRFFPKLDEVCAELHCEPLHMLSVMMSESGVRADAHNDNPKNLPPEKRWNASGLIQFMPATLKGLGWTKGHAEFRKLSATDQLPWVRRYFNPHVGKLVSIGAIYTATFLPALLKHAGNPAFVLTAKDGPLGWAYAPNAVFDTNKDYAITVGELEQAVLRNCRGARWQEIVARLRDNVLPDDPEVEETVPNGPFDLSTIRGLQQALTWLNFDPGPIDGIPGPKTRAAVLAFQKQDGSLVPDGIYGPLTRRALELTLQTRA